MKSFNEAEINNFQNLMVNAEKVQEIKQFRHPSLLRVYPNLFLIVFQLILAHISFNE